MMGPALLLYVHCLPRSIPLPPLYSAVDGWVLPSVRGRVQTRLVRKADRRPMGRKSCSTSTCLGWSSRRSAVEKPWKQSPKLSCRTSAHDSGDLAMRKPWPERLKHGEASVTVAEAIAEISAWLDSYSVVDPEASASELLAKAWGFRSPQDMRVRRARSDPVVMGAAAWDELAFLCRLRSKHTPVQYLVGEWDFHDTSLVMRPPILIPRPETEELVELVLRWLEATFRPRIQGRSGEGVLRFLDVGSGTGAIGLALLKALPSSRCVAIDADESAVELSLLNAERIGVADRYMCFHTRVADLVRSTDGECSGGTVTIDGVSMEQGFDFVVSNPPYIPSADMNGLQADVLDHENWGALDGGKDGLDVVRDIVGCCPRILRRGGLRELWMEVDTSHPALMEGWLGEEVGEGAMQAGVTKFEWMRDMSGHPRFVRLGFRELG
ncbi:unnamed protein product [Discosporangium mesarthrocarpum]